MNELSISEGSPQEAPTPPRIILHIDMDCFYAAVEIRDNHRLKGRPVVVGGRRGVVLTASYEARRFGIHSGMPGFQAAQRCPGLIFVHPRHEAYAEASRQVREIFQRYCNKAAHRSLDESYLDLTADNPKGVDGVSAAQGIRREVHGEIGITCSAGVGPNMMLAKIASDYRKPDGLTVVPPGSVQTFMRGLPLRKIPGIGPATDRRLQRVGLRTCDDVWRWSPNDLAQRFGSRFGAWIARKSRGYDRADVGHAGKRKTYGAQRTIGPRHHPIHELEERLDKIAEGLVERMAKGQHRARTVTLKVRFGDLRVQTRSRTMDVATADAQLFSRIAAELLKTTPAHEERVRLVGLSVSNLVEVQD